MKNGQEFHYKQTQTDVNMLHLINFWFNFEFLICDKIEISLRNSCRPHMSSDLHVISANWSPSMGIYMCGLVGMS